MVFGLGGIGLNVVQGARMAGADMIVGVDLNPARRAMAEKFGMTHFVNPNEVEGDLVPYLVDLTKGGADYSFECIGNVQGDAPGAGVLPQGLGPEHHHRRRRRRPGDRDAAVPAGDRAGSGRAPRSAARAGAPTCRASSIGTWTGASTSTT